VENIAYFTRSDIDRRASSSEQMSINHFQQQVRVHSNVGPTPSGLQAGDYVQLFSVQLSLSNFVGTLTVLIDIPHSRQKRDVTNFRACF
jgi:hypothetical protein